MEHQWSGDVGEDKLEIVEGPSATSWLSIISEDRTMTNGLWFRISDLTGWSKMGKVNLPLSLGKVGSPLFSNLAEELWTLGGRSRLTTSEDCSDFGSLWICSIACIFSIPSLSPGLCLTKKNGQYYFDCIEVNPIPHWHWWCKGNSTIMVAAGARNSQSFHFIWGQRLWPWVWLLLQAHTLYQVVW